ncbi:MAG: helix-turn-helix domain-containing protein [Acidimicrobiia bacterium]
MHVWLREYAAHGLAGLVDGSSRPATCPHQMAPEVEALVVEWRWAHPTWGPRTLVNRLARLISDLISACDDGGPSLLGWRAQRRKGWRPSSIRRSGVAGRGSGPRRFGG